MRICSHCGGFVPDSLNLCPNCETGIHPLKKKGSWSKFLYGITAGSFAMTLMACYGRPPCRDKECRKTEDLRLLWALVNSKESETNSKTNKSINIQTEKHSSESR